MRLLILSETIVAKQRYEESKLDPPYDVQLDVDIIHIGDCGKSVFDNVVSIVHIEDHKSRNRGYINNIPNQIRDL